MNKNNPHPSHNYHTGCILYIGCIWDGGWILYILCSTDHLIGWLLMKMLVVMWLVVNYNATPCPANCETCQGLGFTDRLVKRDLSMQNIGLSEEWRFY